MATQSRRTTIYFDEDLLKALKIRAVLQSRSVSDLVNDAVRESLAEDADDILTFEDRINEPLLHYDEMVKRLKKNGRI